MPASFTFKVMARHNSAAPKNQTKLSPAARDFPPVLGAWAKARSAALLLNKPDTIRPDFAKALPLREKSADKETARSPPRRADLCLLLALIHKVRD